MTNSRPTKPDRVLIKFMSKDRARKEIRKHALDGEAEWVMLLLQKTDYDTITIFLTPEHWKGEDRRALTNVKKVVCHLLEHVPKKWLPPGTDTQRVVSSFGQAIVKSWGKNAPLKPRTK